VTAAENPRPLDNMLIRQEKSSYEKARKFLKVGPSSSSTMHVWQKMKTRGPSSPSKM
jgi:hypothetical protein